ncbi:flagellar basal body rod protein FlgB [Pseudochelatococcus contaminans]|uniref:Flagellar basal-body rod protein FlgB n=1 Tax=Pseudochelatococcus contaminans TaxID=1538103 RepID=A0A7W5Z1A5_9HYPH|nr:flagellar basal body rod protein FlgB [Pseudochelatococcus contaminans]MBB3808022.1 flagellar basal-body rod protein FlgB [Pseudochelatococcus contaminans]
MDPVYLFGLASRKADWLTTRQAVLARNVANANTPGFRSRDIEPFSATMDKTALTLATTAPDHMPLGPAQANAARSRPNKSNESWETYHSGNSVSIEEELLKAGEVSREYGVTTAIVKSFHKFVLSSVRSQG